MLENKTMINVINKRKNPYTASLRNGEYYEWLPATDVFEDSIELSFRDVQYLHTASSTFKDGYLFIDNVDARKRLGLEKESIKVNQLSRQDIEAALKGNMGQFKKTLGLIQNRALLRDVVEIAKEIGIDNVTKLQHLSDISGIPMEIILDNGDK